MTGAPSDRVETEPRSQPPSYPDFRPYVPHPWLPAGINDAFFAGDELNGMGINWPRSYGVWDDIALSQPTVMTAANNFDPELPGEIGQTVDIWVQSEKRTIVLQRDFTKTRAEGRRGHRSTP